MGKLDYTSFNARKHYLKKKEEEGYYFCKSIIYVLINEKMEKPYTSLGDFLYKFEAYISNL